MSSMFGGGGGDVKTVNPPKPLNIDLGQMQSEMVGADQAAWNASDNYMSQYYPSLTNARDNMIKQSFENLTGPLDPTLENTFVNAGNAGSLNAFGAGNQDAGMMFGGGGGGSSWGGSSLARNASSASVARDEQGYQDYNRAMFENLNSLFTPRSFGATPEDAANVFTFNNTQMNNYLQQKFAAQTQSYYQGQSAAASGAAATTGLIGSVASAAIPAIIAAVAA